MRYDIAIGKVTYEPGAPKNAPRWVWKCLCAECAHRDQNEIMHGPFKTRRAAKRDAEQTITLLAAEPCGSTH